MSNRDFFVHFARLTNIWAKLISPAVREMERHTGTGGRLRRDDKQAHPVLSPSESLSTSVDSEYKPPRPTVLTAGLKVSSSDPQDILSTTRKICCFSRIRWANEAVRQQATHLGIGVGALVPVHTIIVAGSVPSNVIPDSKPDSTVSLSGFAPHPIVWGSIACRIVAVVRLRRRRGGRWGERHRAAITLAVVPPDIAVGIVGVAVRVTPRV